MKMREKVANDSEKKKNMTKYYYGTLNEHMRKSERKITPLTWTGWEPQHPVRQ